MVTRYLDLLRLSRVSILRDIVIAYVSLPLLGNHPKNKAVMMVIFSVVRRGVVGGGAGLG